MIRTLTFISLLAIASGTTAQTGERHFDLGRFDAVELASFDRIRIVTGDGFAVTAGGDPRAVATLALSVRGNTLRVDRTPGSHTDRGAVVTVTMPSLRAATLSGSGSIEASGISGRSFTGRITGSGGMTLGRLAVNDARLDLDGSGSIVADGSAQAIDIDLGGSGRIDTRRVAVRGVTIALGGSGSVMAASTGTAIIRASGSGSVRVAGGPRCDVRNSGTAIVRCG